MESVEARSLVRAASEVVWDIITDEGNYPVWDSGITHVAGEMRDGSVIRIRTPDHGNKALRLRVRQGPGQVMTWTVVMALGLARTVRTFTVADHKGMTQLTVSHRATGPFRSVARDTLPGTLTALSNYVEAVRIRAELLGRHGSPVPSDGSGRPHRTSP